MSTLRYIKSLIKDTTVASITPTSRFGVRHVCENINFTKDLTLVEYGPATGVFTKYLLKRTTPHSKLILIEKNEDFVSVLRQKFNSPKIKIFQNSADEVLSVLRESGVSYADYIISGIPFSMFDDHLTDKILKNSRAALKPCGLFLVYQHLNHLKHRLDAYFENVEVTREFLNIPPLIIFKAERSQGNNSMLSV